MAMFMGKLPGKVNLPKTETKVEAKPAETKVESKSEVDKYISDTTVSLKPKTPSFSVPPVKSEEEKLRAKVKELELKIQILEHSQEGYSKNDQEYIKKLEQIVKTEKAVAKAMMLQNVELRMLCGKYAEHLPKIDVTEDNWQEKLKG